MKDIDLKLPNMEYKEFCIPKYEVCLKNINNTDTWEFDSAEKVEEFFEKRFKYKIKHCLYWKNLLEKGTNSLKITIGGDFDKTTFVISQKEVIVGKFVKVK